MVISNSSPLINLAAINKLDLLVKVYGEIVIPEAVWKEVVIDGKGQSGSEAVKRAKWIRKETVTDFVLVSALTLTLDKGESEAITLAKEKNAELLIIDERFARDVADNIGLKYIGTLGVLREAKSKKLISGMKMHMDLLRAKAGFWLSDEVYKEILEIEGEI